MTELINAISYTRISVDEQSQGYPSCEAQLSLIKDYAARKGMRVKFNYSDDPIELKRESGITFVNSRAGIIAIMDQLRSDDWTHLVVHCNSRLERPDLKEDFAKLLTKFGKTIVAVKRNRRRKHETPKPIQKVDKSVARIRVKHEKPVTSVKKRLFNGRIKSARQGFVQGGYTPYGFQREQENGGKILVENKAEADVVRLIFAKYKALKSMLKVKCYLRKKRIKTRRGKDFSVPGIAWILKNTTYIGHIRFRGYSYKGKHKKLIKPKTFHQVQRIIEGNRDPSTPKWRRPKKKLSKVAK